MKSSLKQTKNIVKTKLVEEGAVERIQFQFLETLRIYRGNVGEACKAMKLDRGQYLAWLNDDREFRFQVMVLIEEIGDKVEDMLMRKIMEGDTAATIFYCKTKLKHRGYQEDAKANNTGPSKTKINVMVNLPNQPQTIEISESDAETNS
jgi:hypothetical protein